MNALLKKIKNAAAFMLAVLFAVSFAACSTAPKQNKDPKDENAADITTAAKKEDDPLSTEEWEGFSHDLHILPTGEKTIHAAAYEHFCWASTYAPEMNSMLEADGPSFYSQLPEILDELPVFESDPGFDLWIAGNCMITEIHIYNTAYAISSVEPLGLNEFLKLARNAKMEFTCDIIVEKTLDYIESCDEYERWSNGYAFRIKPKEGAETTFCPGDHGMLLLMTEDENGALNEIEPYLCGVCMSADYPVNAEAGSYGRVETDGCFVRDRLSEVRDELPVIPLGAVITAKLPTTYPSSIDKIMVYRMKDGAVTEDIELRDMNGLNDLLKSFEGRGEADELAVEIIVHYSKNDWTDGIHFGVASGFDSYSFIVRP